MEETPGWVWFLLGSCCPLALAWVIEKVQKYLDDKTGGIV